jgi:hypothetical protein
MRIGYCVEGSTDRALLIGLHRRWCPAAEMMEGRFRGAFRRREIPKACRELEHKGADLIIMMRDANDENWRDVMAGDQNCCSAAHQHLTIFAVCGRNVESWLTADPYYASARTGCPADSFRVADPKAAFQAAMGITAPDRKEREIAHYTHDAPLKIWLTNDSFENFYEQLRQRSKTMNCGIENLRAARS